MMVCCGSSWKAALEKGLGDLVDTKSNVSQQHALTAKEADGIFGCIWQSNVGR